MKLHCPTAQEIESRLRGAGVRPTAQRIAVAQFVLCSADHPTAEDVKKWTDENFPKLSMATVYNTLAALVEAGLLRKFSLPHSSSVIYDQNIQSHNHFLDEKSGKLYDLGAGEVAVHLKPGTRATVKRMDILLRGDWGK